MVVMPVVSEYRWAVYVTLSDVPSCSTPPKTCDRKPTLGLNTSATPKPRAIGAKIPDYPRLPRVSGFLEITNQRPPVLQRLKRRRRLALSKANARRFLLRLKQRSRSVLESEVVFVSAVIGVGSLPVVF
jgi:hypothetical protein